MGAYGAVRVAVAWCVDGRGVDEPTVAWRCEADDADSGARPLCDVQPVHTTTQTIAAARRIRRG
jgi:hypothetical protein